MLGHYSRKEGTVKRRFKLRKSTIYVIYVRDAEEGEGIVLSGEKVVRSRKAGIKRLRELRERERNINGTASA